MFGLATTLLLLAAALGPTQQDERATNLDVIIGQIGALESDNDPKCHATATRLENFIFGTPLTSQARARKVELQKELVAIIWRRASELATSSASETVLPEHMHEAIASVLDYRATDSGGVTVGDIELSERDAKVNTVSL